MPCFHFARESNRLLSKDKKPDIVLKDRNIRKINPMVGKNLKDPKLFSTIFEMRSHFLKMSLDKNFTIQHC
jgi:hypothetical protein